MNLNDESFLGFFFIWIEIIVNYLIISPQCLFVENSQSKINKEIQTKRKTYYTTVITMFTVR